MPACHLNGRACMHTVSELFSVTPVNSSAAWNLGSVQFVSPAGVADTVFSGPSEGRLKWGSGAPGRERRVRGKGRDTCRGRVDTGMGVGERRVWELGGGGDWGYIESSCHPPPFGAQPETACRP